MINLQGNQVCLRDWQIEDLPQYQKWLDGEQQWKKFNGPYYPQMNKTEANEHLVKIEKRIKENKLTTPRRKMVITDHQNNNFLGDVSWYWQSKETHWLSIGIIIYNPAFWSKGIGYEAYGLWCQYLFNHMPELARLDMRSWSGNTGLMKLAEKLGFQLEATFRKARIVEGEYYDGVGYGVLREEWTALYPNGFEQHLKNKRIKK